MNAPTPSPPARPARRWACAGRVIEIRERPLVMGILNVTPDSFSDGGRYLDPATAVVHARRMLEDGADILDVGGESTRPGAADVPADEEIRRVVPVIEAVVSATGAVVSVDTMKAEVARRAIRAGARIINDVSAFTHDPAMPDAAAESGAGVVLMHMQGTPRTMQVDPRYGDVVREVADFLAARVRALAARGLRPEALALDPGIGFGKTVEHNLALLARLDALRTDDRPLVVGLSRKSFLGKLTGLPVEDRLAPSLAALAFCAARGADVMRVHDVRESRAAILVAAALRDAA